MAKSKSRKAATPSPSSKAPIYLALGAVALLGILGIVGVGIVIAWSMFNSRPPAAQATNKPQSQSQAQDEAPLNKPSEKTEADKRDVVRLPEIKFEPSSDFLVQAKPQLVLDSNGHSATVTRVLLTPDNRQLITTSQDRSIRIIDVDTGETIRVLRPPIGPGDEGALFAAALSPDGQKLAVTGSPVGRGKSGVPIHIIDLTLGQVERVINAHRQTIAGLEYSRDGALLASAADDNTVRLFEVATGETRKTLPHPGGVRQAIFAPDGKRIATVTFTHKAFIWDVASGKMVKELSAPLAFVSVAWSPDSSTVVTGSLDGSLQTWSADGALQKQIKIVQGRKLQPVTIGFVNDHEVMYGGVEFVGEAGVVNLKTGQRRLNFPHHDNTVFHASVSNDRQLVVSTGGDDHDIIIWRPTDGSIVQRIKGSGKSVFGVGWHRDGKTIAWGNTNRGRTTLAQPPIERSFRLDELEFGPPPARDFLRIPARVDGYELEAIDFFRIAIKKDGKQIHTWTSPLQQDRVFSFSLIGGGKAVMGTGFSLFLIDVENNRTIREFHGHAGIVFGVSPSPDGRFFLTGSSDQTVRLWKPDQNDPVLSLFFAGNDWIAWTPEGYFAASAYGERLMGWQINDGLERLGIYYPAAFFRASLYKPAAIKLLLQEGDLRTAMAKVEKRDVPLTKVSQVLPPAVGITSPGVPAKTNKTRLEVKAVARSVGNHPVTAMRLLVNGRPYQGDKGIRRFDKPKLGDVKATWEVDLMPGKHVLAVLSESEASKSLSAPREVTVEGVGKEELPNLYVVSIGISDYPGRLALKFAAKDAIVLEKTIRERTAGVFNKVETKLITDKKATRKEIVESLRWLESKMTARDVGILFFGGHGSRDPLGRFLLVPVDLDEKEVDDNCIQGELVKRSLAAMPGRLIAMLDACHSGAINEKRRGSADDLVRDLISEEYGVVCMCSSLGREYSLESGSVEHGFFTLGLVEGLRGKADFNRDGYIYLHEVDLYANQRVRELSEGEQNPVTGRPPNIRSFPLARP